VARLDEVLDKAGRIVEAEKKIAKAIRKGVDVAALLKIDEKLARKATEVFVPQLQIENP
jgi:FAD synthase